MFKLLQFTIFKSTHHKITPKKGAASNDKNHNNDSLNGTTSEIWKSERIVLANNSHLGQSAAFQSKKEENNQFIGLVYFCMFYLGMSVVGIFFCGAFIEYMASQKRETLLYVISVFGGLTIISWLAAKGVRSKL